MCAATVHCLDRRTEPDSEFLRVSTQVAEKFGGTLNYAQVDVRDADKVESTISSIADRYRRLDGTPFPPLLCSLLLLLLHPALSTTSLPYKARRKQLFSAKTNPDTF